MKVAALRIALGLIALSALIGLSVLVAVCVSAGGRWTPEPSDCIVVLGCRVWPDGRLSNALTYRCEAALEAWQSGVAPVIIACGGQGASEPAAEAEAMRGWMVEHGVPEDAVVLEDRSVNTRQNLQNAHVIMNARGYETAAICTTNYHLRRALWLARDEGIAASGIPARSTRNVFSFVHGRLRETCSWILYFLRKIG